MDGGAYTSEARSWSDTPLCASDGRAGHGGSLRSWGRAGVGGGRLPVIGGLTPGGLISYQGN